MDIAKLEKMKVVDLRNELQSRGLETKGIKAVLIERLKQHLEASATATSETPTPSSQIECSRNTHSPSPVQANIEINLEPLEEEEEKEDVTNLLNTENKGENFDQITVTEEEKSTNQVNTKVVEEEDIQLEKHPLNANEEKCEEDDLKDPFHNNEEQNKDELYKENTLQCEEVHLEEKELKEKRAIKIKNQLETKSTDDNTRRGAKKSRSRSHTKSRSRSPRRRYQTPVKTSDESTNAEDEPTIEDKQFGLSWYDSDLHLRIDPVTFTSAKPMNHEICSLVWSGVRTNYGVRDGKVCFEVRLAEEMLMSRSHQFRNEQYVRGFRVGFSLADSTLLLGETENSFAYCESGRKANNSDFADYGKPFKLDDVIGCYLNLESEPCTIKYTLNGEDLGVAFTFEKDILGEKNAMFPHIVTKGYEFHVNFADNENLLVNIERPKRMCLKPRKIEKDTNSGTVDGTNKEIKQQNGCEKEESKADTSENVEITEVLPTENVDTEMMLPTKDVKDDDIKEISSDNIDAKEVGADEDNVKKEKLEKTEGFDEIRKNVEKHGKIDENDDEEEGPSPNKRQKEDDEMRERQLSSSGSEYEEIVPEPRDPVSLLEEYELIALIPEEKYIPGPQRPESRKECEVILMVGLHGAGKTHWVLNHIKENPNKRYHVIGVDALIAKMTIDGSPRKLFHKGRWDKVYDSCLNSLNSLEDIATKRRRNFILDQTNVYASAQRRKMKGFGDFKRISVVCIPNDEELKRRITEKAAKEFTNTVKESTLNSLRASFSLPSLEFGWFDDIIYSDLSGEEAKEEVKKYNEKGKKAVDSSGGSNRDHDRRYNQRDRYQQRNDRRRYDDRRQADRWTDRRSIGSGGSGGSGNRWVGGNRYGGGGGGPPGYRDDRSYGAGVGVGNRGYDNRNRYGGSGGGGGPSNWVSNTRNNRYDDRYNRGRFDSYSGSRDYRDRNRNAGGGNTPGSGRRDNYRSASGNQRDFRHGHRDIRVDSRGGYDRSASSKCSSNEGYDQLSKNGKATAGNEKGGKWGVYQSKQQHNTMNITASNWQNQSQGNTQQQYWGYDEMQNFGNQQRQDWSQSGSSEQNQEWSAWWQQQQGQVQVPMPMPMPMQQQQQQQQLKQQQQQKHSSNSEGNHYWSQYSSLPTSLSTSTETVTK